MLDDLGGINWILNLVLKVIHPQNREMLFQIIYDYINLKYQLEEKGSTYTTYLDDKWLVKDFFKNTSFIRFLPHFISNCGQTDFKQEINIIRDFLEKENSEKGNCSLDKNVKKILRFIMILQKQSCQLMNSSEEFVDVENEILDKLLFSKLEIERKKGAVLMYNKVMKTEKNKKTIEILMDMAGDPNESVRYVYIEIVEMILNSVKYEV